MSDSSSSAAATTRRKYVDPWDLDLREVSWRHSSDTTDCSADLHAVSLSSAAGPESARSDFVYVPGSPSPVGDEPAKRSSAVRYECCQCSPEQSLQRPVVPPRPVSADSYEYWEPATGGRRKPSPPPPPPPPPPPTHPPPQTPPPPYGYAVDDRFYAAGSPNQCRPLYNVSGPEVRRNSRHNNSDADSMCRAHEISSGEYDSVENVTLTSSQFRYNTLGHMKIDYSSNWNNLDKYICRV